MGGANSTILYAQTINNPDKQDNETDIYRNPNSVGKDIFNLVPEMPTLQDLLRKRFEHPDHDFIGKRNIDPITGKLENKFTFQTNKEIQTQAEFFGSGLLNLNLVPEINEYRNYAIKMLGIYSKNTIEYLVSDIAAILYGVSMVPIYDTLGEEATIFAFKKTKMASCIITANHVEKILKQKHEGKLEFLQNIIIPDFAEVKPEFIEANKDVMNFYSFQQIIEAGRSNTKPWSAVTPDTVYCFSFTSGTVGEPKGAFITHKNIISLVPGVKFKVHEFFQPKDCHLSYLPMAHVLERVCYICLTHLGCKIGVYSGDVQKVSEDAQILKPTIFVSVPRMFARIYDGIKKNIDDQSGFKKRLFEHAMQSKLNTLEATGGVTHSIYDKLIFSKIKEKLGGNVRMMITGSAPIDGTMLKFLKCAFCCPILEGYGQTEACAIEFVTDMSEPLAGHVGGPQLQNEFKLVDVPEMQYFSTDKDHHGNPSPRGEIWVRGPNIIPGYYLNEEQSAETFSSDGWLRSGDVGQILHPNNALKIIDRKKNIFKLQQGEYIAPEKLENVFKLATPLVSEVFVYGDGMRSCVVGIVVMDPSAITKFAEQNGLDASQDPMTLKDSPDFIKKLNALLSQTGKANKLNGLEMMKNLYIETKPFTDNGLLTATFKIKRHEAKDFYAEKIDELYAKLPTA